MFFFLDQMESLYTSLDQHLAVFIDEVVLFSDSIVFIFEFEGDFFTRWSEHRYHS